MVRPKSVLTCWQCRSKIFTSSTTRSFTSTSRRKQDALTDQTQSTPARQPNKTEAPATTPRKPIKAFESEELESLAKGARAEATTRPGSGVSLNEPYHLNVFAHKHNMHITFSEPSRNPIISYSAGNIGLKKAQRGTFDAAYQLATYTMRKMAEKQWRTGGKAATFNKMLTLNEKEVQDRGIEVVLRGFGPGREAFQKALLGTEGRVVRPLIKKVTDGTRLKFGGPRSRAVRRLG